MTGDLAGFGKKGRKLAPRYAHRERSHAQAHALVANEPQPRIPDHPSVPRTPPSFINTAEGLADLLEHLCACRKFAYDSEFIGEASFLPRLCLIQVATEHRIALVDALAGLDLNAFWSLLADPSVEKTVHAGQQDLEHMFRQTGLVPRCIFDTQICAGFVGLAYPVSLSRLVKELIGVSLGKGFTFTHWDRRPLSQVQIRYAADDVRYLPALRQIIGHRLEAAGLTAWAREQCDSLCDPELYRKDPAEDVSRVRGSGSLSGRELAILRELVRWRHAAAQADDLPPRTYLKDDVLLSIARRAPRSDSDLSAVRGVPRPVLACQGRAILDAVQRGLAIPECDWPAVSQNEESAAERFAADALWAAVQGHCAGQGIDPALVTSRSEIARVLREWASTGSLPADSRLMRGWRRQLLGDLLIRFLAGTFALRLSWEADHLCSAAFPLDSQGAVSRDATATSPGGTPA